MIYINTYSFYILLYIHIRFMKMTESPLFSSFRGKHCGVCNLKGQTMQHRNIATGVNQYQQPSAGHHEHQHCMYITEESQWQWQNGLVVYGSANRRKHTNISSSWVCCFHQHYTFGTKLSILCCKIIVGNKTRSTKQHKPTCTHKISYSSIQNRS